MTVGNRNNRIKLLSAGGMERVREKGKEGGEEVSRQRKD